MRIRFGFGGEMQFTDCGNAVAQNDSLFDLPANGFRDRDIFPNAGKIWLERFYLRAIKQLQDMVPENTCEPYCRAS